MGSHGDKDQPITSKTSGARLEGKNFSSHSSHKSRFMGAHDAWNRHGSDAILTAAAVVSHQNFEILPPLLHDAAVLGEGRGQQVCNTRNGNLPFHFRLL